MKFHVFLQEIQSKQQNIGICLQLTATQANIDIWALQKKKEVSVQMVQKFYWIFNLQKSYPYEVFYAKLDKINCI